LKGIDVATLTDRLRGKFIVLDGPDGAGKSTQIKRLDRALSEHGVAVLSCRDPGGTKIGERIRSVLLDHDLSEMDPTCETFLFMASRAQLLGEVIRPALDAGKAVLCDRFVSSTCAYQGAAGFDPRRVIEVGRFAVGDLWPHLTVVIDVEIEAGLSRIAHRNGDAGGDAMERRSVAFHHRVRDIYHELPDYYPSPVRLVDGRGDAQTVHQRILECLSDVTA